MLGKLFNPLYGVVLFKRPPVAGIEFEPVVVGVWPDHVLATAALARTVKPALHAGGCCVRWHPLDGCAFYNCIWGSLREDRMFERAKLCSISIRPALSNLVSLCQLVNDARSPGYLTKDGILLGIDLATWTQEAHEISRKKTGQAKWTQGAYHFMHDDVGCGGDDDTVFTLTDLTATPGTERS